MLAHYAKFKDAKFSNTMFALFVSDGDTKEHGRNADSSVIVFFADQPEYVTVKKTVKPTGGRAEAWWADYGRSETSTVTLNFVSNSEGSQDCK